MELGSARVPDQVIRSPGEPSILRTEVWAIASASQLDGETDDSGSEAFLVLILRYSRDAASGTRSHTRKLIRYTAPSKSAR